MVTAYTGTEAEWSPEDEVVLRPLQRAHTVSHLRFRLRIDRYSCHGRLSFSASDTCDTPEVFDAFVALPRHGAVFWRRVRVEEASLGLVEPGSVRESGLRWWVDMMTSRATFTARTAGRTSSNGKFQLRAQLGQALISGFGGQRLRARRKARDSESNPFSVPFFLTTTRPHHRRSHRAS